MCLEAGDCLGLSNLRKRSSTAAEANGGGGHLSHCVHCSADADLRLDGLQLVVEQHAHAGLHGNSQPKQEVVVLAEQRVLEVDGGVRDDEQAGQRCRQSVRRPVHSHAAGASYRVWRE